MPTPETDPTPSRSVQFELGPNMTRVLGAFVAILLIVAQAYAIYLNRETKAEVQDVRVRTEEARNEATRSLMQAEKNGVRLKRAADDKLAQDNRHRLLIGQPPLRPDLDE